MRSTDTTALNRRHLIAGMATASAAVAVPAWAQGNATIVKIVGDRSKLCLMSDGTVIGWGWSDGRFYGKIRIDSKNLEYMPIRIALPGPAIDVANSDKVSFAVLQDGSVYAWGYGPQLAFGQWAGPSTVEDARNPHVPADYCGGQTTLADLPATPAAPAPKKKKKSNWASSLGNALGADATTMKVIGMVENGGSEDGGSTANPLTGMISQASGGMCPVNRDNKDAILEAGGGGAISGTTGAGPLITERVYPVSTPSLGYSNYPPFPAHWETVIPRRIQGLSNIKRIEYGDAAVALSNDGRIFVWGQCGGGSVPAGVREPNGNFNTVLCPIEVPGVSGIKDISARNAVVLALTQDGRIISWGNNWWGGLGREGERLDSFGTYGTEKPDYIPNFTNVAAIRTGANMCAALKTDGTVWVWGSNENGMFGNGLRNQGPNLKDGFDIIPQQVAGVSNVVELSVAHMGRHVFAVLKDGTVRGWGNTDFGQLGNGIKGTYQEKVIIPHIKGVKHIWASGNNSFAMKTDGSLWAWGYGSSNLWPFTTNQAEPQPFKLPQV